MFERKYWGMFEKLKQMRILKRLKTSSMITAGLASIAALVATIALFYMGGQYNHALTYYAFPQGTLGLAMKELADIRSATRGAVGYERQDRIDKMLEYHEAAEIALKNALPAIEATIVTDIGRESYNEIVEKVEAYLEIDAKVIELGATTDPELKKQAEDLVFSDMVPAYAEAAFAAFMDANIALGDDTQSSLQILQNILTIVVIVCIGISAFVAIRIGTMIAHGIAKPLEELGERMTTFAEGDISSPFPKYEYNDEVGDMLKSVTSATEKLSLMVNDLESLLEDMSNGNFRIKTSCEEAYVGDFNTLLMGTRKTLRQMDATLKEVRGASGMVLAGAGNLAEAAQALAEFPKLFNRTLQLLKRHLQPVKNWQHRQPIWKNWLRSSS